jgi:hypothetical protein
VKVILAALCLLMVLVGGCGTEFVVGQTRTIAPPPLPRTMTGAEVEFAMFPAVYTVGNNLGSPYVKGATVDLKYIVFNDLDFPSPATLSIKNASTASTKRNAGYVNWQESATYCLVADNTFDIPAHGSREVTIRINVPEGVTCPAKWIFYVSYVSEGHKWGSYVTTPQSNYVFYPGMFQANVTDISQQLAWTTSGNSATIRVISKYGSPPTSMDDGKLVYQGLGEQQIKKWQDPKSGLWLDRQYTYFSVTDNQRLPTLSGTKLFYRAWQQHTVNSVWDGTWDVLGQSTIIPEVMAKVLINM